MLYWCLSCNTPLVSRVCSRCSSPGAPVKTSIYSDPRPASRWGLSLLREVLERDYGHGAYEALLPLGDSCVLFGRAPYLDVSYEVIADGAVLGYLFYDLYTWRWLFKPSKPGAMRLLEQGLMEEVDASGSIGSRICPAPPGSPPFKLLSGLRGLAERRGSTYFVSKLYPPGSLELAEVKQSSMLEANLPALAEMESKAVVFIIRESRKRRHLVVSYSGGKDSTVVLKLAERSELSFKVYFNDTGLEMPETLEVAEKALRSHDSIRGEAGDAFWRTVQGFGPPARDYRWCCKVCKLAPTYRALKETQDALVLVGQRRYESASRRRAPPVWRNRWVPGVLSASPVNSWSALAVWLYIRWRKLGYNPLYEAGFDRIGCFMCPASRIAELKLVEEMHPKLAWKWSLELRRWAERRKLPESWLRYHLWRWVKPPERVLRLAGLTGTYPRNKVALRASSSALEVEPYSQDRMLKLARTAGRLRGLELEAGEAKLKLLGDRIEYHGSLEVVLPIASKLAARAMLCPGCSVCTAYCPVGALKPGAPAEASDRCTSCSLCSEVCPILEYPNANVVAVSQQPEALAKRKG